MVDTYYMYMYLPFNLSMLRDITGVSLLSSCIPWSKAASIPRPSTATTLQSCWLTLKRICPSFDIATPSDASPWPTNARNRVMLSHLWNMVYLWSGSQGCFCLLYKRPFLLYLIKNQIYRKPVPEKVPVLTFYFLVRHCI